MPYELTPTQQKFVESQVAKGAFESTDKVVEAALSLLSDREREKELLAEAIAQDERGEHVPFDIEKIKATGRSILQARQSASEC